MITIAAASAPTDVVRQLVEEVDATLSAHYAPHERHGLTLEAIFQPHIRLFIAEVDGGPAGCGAVALLDGFAEVKRMYVRPEFRGTGVSAALLGRLEAAATEAGYRIVRLETGTEQQAAIRFYKRSSFVTCEAFGDYRRMPREAVARSVFMEKRLGP